MDEKSWDSLADDYDKHVFDALANDSGDVMRRRILKRGNRKRVVADVGCGVGKFLPLLGEHFKSVHAIDHSKPLLRKAESSCKAKGFSNIDYHQRDLTRKNVRLPKVDLALCVNMVITPSPAGRIAIFKALARCVKRGGHLLLVVPSLESVLFANQRLVQWNLRSGLSVPEAYEVGFESEKVRKRDVLRQGLFDAGGIPTKHYLLEELPATLGDYGFSVQSIAKVEYPWSMEFLDPPEWMKAPYPWDWIVDARRKRKG